MSTEEVMKILTFAFSVIGTGLGAFATIVSKKTQLELDGRSNTEDIKTMGRRLDTVQAEGRAFGREGDSLRTKLVGLSGDNGLVHDIIKLQRQVEELSSAVAILGDRVGVRVKDSGQ